MTVTGNLIAPFNFVPVVLGLCAALIATKWTENYGSGGGGGCGGDGEEGGKAGASGGGEGESAGSCAAAASEFLQAARMVLADRRLFLLGMMGALIEATLYIFIFLWTPALEVGASEHGGERREVRHGVVFGAFMTWNMLGAQLCKRLLARPGIPPPETLISGVIGISVLSLLLPVVTSNFGVLIAGFCVFEAGIGAYWPLVMKLRSDQLGEGQRAAVTSLFRVPLNVVVCLVLLRAGTLGIQEEFGLCVFFLAVALGCQRMVVRPR